MPLSNPKFEESYGRLFGSQVSAGESADPFFAEFYSRFLKAGSVREMFTNTDMDKQISMMKQSLYNLVAFYVTNSPSPELERLAALHAKLGVGPEMFDDWLEALIDTVAAKDYLADNETLLAWCWALSPGVTYMRLNLMKE